eukprot:SAG11_NODE_523_length_8775_cov_29.592900_1_plen_485_part_00
MSTKDDGQREGNGKGVGLGSVGGEFDSDIYGGGNKFEGYATELTEEPPQVDDPSAVLSTTARRQRIEGPSMSAADDDFGGDVDPFADTRAKTIAEREDEYHARRRQRILSPARADPFAQNTPSGEERTYKDVMQETALSNEKEELLRAIAEKKEEQEQKKEEQEQKMAAPPAHAEKKEGRKRRRWDVGTEETPDPGKAGQSGSNWEQPESSSSVAAAAAAGGSRWDATPDPASLGMGASSRRNRWDETPVPSSEAGGGAGSTQWDETPAPGAVGATPSASKRGRSRWDETPVGQTVDTAGATPAAGFGSGANAAFMTPGATPMGAADMSTPAIHAGSMDPAQVQAMRWERELDERNRPLSDEELDAMFPQEGYVTLEPPPTYQPIRTPARRLAATPTPMAGTPMYQLPGEDRGQRYDLPPTPSGNLPPLKQDDYQFFEKLLVDEDEDALCVPAIHMSCLYCVSCHARFAQFCVPHCAWAFGSGF